MHPNTLSHGRYLNMKTNQEMSVSNVPFHSLKSDCSKNCCKSLPELYIPKSKKMIALTEFPGPDNPLTMFIYETIVVWKISLIPHGVCIKFYSL